MIRVYGFYTGWMLEQLATTLLALDAWLFVFNFQSTAFERTPVEVGNRVARLVTFHFDKTEALALAAEQVFHQRQGTNCSVLGKELLQGCFRGMGRETSNK